MRRWTDPSSVFLSPPASSRRRPSFGKETQRSGLRGGKDWLDPQTCFPCWALNLLSNLRFIQAGRRSIELFFVASRGATEIIFTPAIGRSQLILLHLPKAAGRDGRRGRYPSPTPNASPRGAADKKDRKPQRRGMGRIIRNPLQHKKFSHTWLRFVVLSVRGTMP